MKTITNYIFGVVAAGMVLDQTSLDENNRELAYEILKEDNPTATIKNIELIETYNEEVEG